MQSSKNLIKTIGRKIILFPLNVFNYIGKAYGNILNQIRPSLRLEYFDEQLRYIYSIKREVKHNADERLLTLEIHTPNTICGDRADTFSTKEPETLAWIDEFGGDGAFYDIGANIGLYSLYYAASKPGSVYAFEPSVLNLKMLAQNIYANKLNERIRIIKNPLTDNNHFAEFRISSLDEGGALSSFGVDYGHNGEQLDTKFQYQTLGLTLDFLLAMKLIKEPPMLIKIDVDGIEHLILNGAINTLKSEKLRSLLIEVNEDFQAQSTGVSQILRSNGFYLRSRQHSSMVESSQFSKSFNQIWVRNNSL